VIKSLAYNPKNHYAQYLKVYIELAENFDLARARRELDKILNEDRTRLDVMQELGKICYTMEAYEDAWKYYKEFTERKTQYDLDIFPGEDIKIAYALSRLGRDELAKEFYEKYWTYSDNDQSIYHELNLSAFYAATGDIQNGMEHLKKFSSQRDIQYWVVLMLDKDPIIRELSAHPDYEATLKAINEGFWQQHRERRKFLEEKGVL
jgi:tetratricopeptide (TPR) repeat protein